ncbi:MAG: hypothetical protein HRT86_05565 [Ilumatobacteraceae bacterium]|nr:hypothetical protein [Ilumatobacteraceae bacterium]
MAITLEVQYFNSFWMKRLYNLPGTTNGTPRTGPSINIEDGYNAPNLQNDWYIEEARIRGGYNNVSTDYGVKAYIVEDEPRQQTFGNTLIYSGIYNSRTGINQTNQFSVAEEITRALDPIEGTIQKLYAEDTNLIVFQEKKVNRALIDKDAIYTAEGQAITTSGQQVIGQFQAYGGNFGISQDPGSFAVYGYRKYFTDRDRNAVLRLSMDGITEINNYGMIDWFRDNLSSVTTSNGEITGGWDMYNKNYTLNITNTQSNTLSFDESSNGWTSFYSYNPQLMTSCLGQFYSWQDNKLWQHYSNADANNFYNTSYRSSVHLILNPNPIKMKTFKTINYEGSSGWEVIDFYSEVTGADEVNGAWVNYSDTTLTVPSYFEGQWVDPATNITYRQGFDRKQNVYMASLLNNSGPRDGEVIFDGSSSTGIKAFYANVIMQTDLTTDPGSQKQLFTVGSNFATN